MGAGGSDFVKGGKLLNKAYKSRNLLKSGVHPIVKKAAKKSLKKAGKYLFKEFLGGSLEAVFIDQGIYLAKEEAKKLNESG